MVVYVSCDVLFFNSITKEKEDYEQKNTIIKYEHNTFEILFFSTTAAIAAKEFQ